MAPSSVDGRRVGVVQSRIVRIFVGSRSSTRLTVGHGPILR